MLIESSDDVVLLNSDTLVTRNWLTKLQRAAYSRPKIGTVTPLTNNGTLASVPRFLENNHLPPGFELGEFAQIIESCSNREYVSVPTCVGFCTYIRREMLDSVGVFDPVFGKGYGEENDLSLRGAAAGYDNIIDDATFIFHHGNMSFREMREALSEQNGAIINERYPHYNTSVARFCGNNPLNRVQNRIWNILQAAFVNKRRRSVLHILHNGPRVERNHNLGGTELHVKSIIDQDPSSAHFSLVASKGSLVLTAHLDCGDREILLPTVFKLKDLINPGFFTVVHLHHSIGFNLSDLKHALLKHGNYLVSVHDYHWICNRLFLLAADGEVCDGFKCGGNCGETGRSNAELRELSLELFKHARKVVVLSESSKSIMSRVGVPESLLRIVRHGIAQPARRIQSAPPQPRVGEPLRIVSVGTLVQHKGADLIRRLAAELREVSGVPIEWHFIGRSDCDSEGLICHGEYSADSLSSMLGEVSPHAALLVPRCQETYSVTLDELISHGLAIITGPHGALPDRVKDWGVGYVCDYSVEGIKVALTSIVSEWERHLEMISKTVGAPILSVESEVEQFGQMYVELSAGSTIDGAKLIRWLQPDPFRLILRWLSKKLANSIRSL